VDLAVGMPLPPLGMRRWRRRECGHARPAREPIDDEARRADDRDADCDLAPAPSFVGGLRLGTDRASTTRDKLCAPVSETTLPLLGLVPCLLIEVAGPPPFVVLVKREVIGIES